MCESKAVIRENGVEKVLLEDVALLELREDGIVLYSLSGERVELKDASISRIDFINHKIYLTKKSG